MKLDEWNSLAGEIQAMMDKLKENATLLCINFNRSLKEEFEKSGLAHHGGDLQGFQSNVEKALEELFNEIEVKTKTIPQIPSPPSMPAEPAQRRELNSSLSASTLVIQFGKPVKDSDECSLKNEYKYSVKNWRENFPFGYVIMGELVNGNCRTLKAPAVFGWHPEGKLVCMKAATQLATSSDSPPELWECNNRAGKRLKDIEAGQYGKILLKFSPQFLSSFLIQEMKRFAKSGTPSTLTTAIVTFPMHYTCKQRVHLKEAAKLAGFQDVYLLSEEGLTAYYWFAKRVELKENDKYSKNIVIVTCGTSSFVVYRRLFKSQENGQQKMIVEAVQSTELQAETQVLFEQLKKIGISGAGCHIPVLCKYLDNADPSPDFRRLLKNAQSNDFSVGIVKNEDINYYAVRAATFLSDKPEDLKKRIRNTLGTSVLIGVERAMASNQLLPETCSRITSTIKHYSSPHKLTAYYTCGKDWMGNLCVVGVRQGAELKVTFELTWEGIWKVVDVSTKRKDKNGEKTGFTWIPSANNSRESNGSLVHTTSVNAAHLEQKVDQENGKGRVSDADTCYARDHDVNAAAREGVAVGGCQNVKKRQALMAMQPNANVMNIHSSKKIKLDPAEVKAEEVIMKVNDLDRKIKEFKTEKIIVEVDPNLWDIENDFEN